jgi:dTDP-4-dehydrorhamnose reductase
MTRKQILVLGSAGMAGHLIEAYLGEAGHHVIGADIRLNPFAQTPTLKIDFRQQNDLVDLLGDRPWDFVINAVGVLNRCVDSNPYDGIFLNSVLPHLIAKTILQKKTSLIHLSTDCVFSGRSGKYTERDFRDGDTFYDRSKALGEIVNSKDLTLRQSIIGPDMHPSGIGLFNWFMQAPESLDGYTNAIWNGVTTLQLAKGIGTIVSSLPMSGLYHYVTPDPISKHDLLRLFALEFRRNVMIRPTALADTLDKSLINTSPQPALTIPGYSTQLKEMRAWIDEHPKWYPHYRFS